MIPKIIHYCWLSNDPLPRSFKRYFNGWKKVLPDYEFMLWNFDRFPKSKSIWVREAFENRKYAFAADYIRLYALYNYGGIYLDTDVDVLKSFSPFLEQHEMLCWENGGEGTRIEAATMGAEKGCWWLKHCLDYYENRHFVTPEGLDTKVLPVILTEILLGEGCQMITINELEKFGNLMSDKKTIPVYSYDYFSPKSSYSGKIEKTNNTVSIHDMAGSWVSGKERRRIFVRKLLLKFNMWDSEISHWLRNRK